MSHVQVDDDREEGSEEVEQLIADVGSRGGGAVKFRKTPFPTKGDDDGMLMGVTGVTEGAEGCVGAAKGEAAAAAADVVAAGVQ